MKRWALFALTFLFVACTQTQRTSPIPRPYIVPMDAAKNALHEWNESEVKACFGEPKGKETIAGWPREFYARSDCKLYFMFRDGKVHSVEGYGNVQECWWVMDACERGLEFRTAPTDQWRSWTREEVDECFGASAERAGCSIRLTLEPSGRVWMSDWIETKTGACMDVLRSCKWQ